VRFIAGRRGLTVGLALLALGAILPLLPFVYPVFAIDLVCFALVALAFDLLLGFTGLLSFGHAMFWGGSGYAVTILIAHGVTSFPLAILAGILYSFVVALLVGAISVKRSGVYFSMITLAIAQIFYFLAFQLVDLTGGENGLQITTRGSFFGLSLENDRVYYYVVLAITALCAALAVRIVTSPFGQVLAAMRENETRAKSIGYDTDRFKLAAFVMSGTLAGLAGSLYAIGNRLSGLDGVDWHTSGAIIMMTILGGIGTIYGPIVGAAIFQSLEYFISKTPIGDKTDVVMGLIFAIVILIARRGVVGEVLHRAFTPKTRLVEDEDDPDRLIPDPELNPEVRQQVRFAFYHFRVAHRLDDLAVHHQVVAVGDARREAQVLLDEQNGHAGLLISSDQVADRVDDHGREALGRFVEENQLRAAAQHARDREHLLLAARERRAHRRPRSLRIGNNS
jgi:branched-chain amino acid transport system permease protein